MALVRSVLSAAYWFLILAMFYGAVAGDRNPAAAPANALQTYAMPVLIVVGGILVHALLLRATERRTRRATLP